MPLYDYRCTECDVLTSEMRSMDERDIPPPCVSCGETTAMVRHIQAPGLMIQAMPDGMRRGDMKFMAAKEAVNLEASMMNMRPQDRGPIRKEIRKLKEVK